MLVKLSVLMGSPGRMHVKVGLWLRTKNQAPGPVWWALHTELKQEGQIPASSSVGQHLLARPSGASQNRIKRQMLRKERLLPGKGLRLSHPDTWAPEALGHTGHMIFRGHLQREERMVRQGKTILFTWSGRKLPLALLGRLILPSVLGKITLMHWQAGTSLTVSP